MGIRRVKSVPSDFLSGSTSRGFTLIELIVVITLISMMMVFTMPNIRNAVLTDKNRKISNWITAKITSLKGKAVQTRQRQTLHLDTAEGRMWITDASMDEETLDTAEESGFELPEGYILSDVEFPEKGTVSTGAAEIRFFPAGYSDKALIHIEDEEGNPMTFAVEPFLHDVKRFESYVEFED